MITLKDIAKKAGVSVMTVSRVVNGNHSKVSAQTAERIQKIVDEMGYVPNYSARSLISKKTNIVAIILRKDSKPDDPYNAKMLAEIIPFLQDKGYFSMVVCLDAFEEVNQYLRSWHAAGAIFLGLFEEDILKIKKEHQIPLIFTDSYYDIPGVINVGINDYLGGQLAASHFIDMGHKTFAFASYALNNSPITQARWLGFSESLQEHGYKVEPNMVMTDHSPEHIVDKLIKSKVTSVFITADILALDVMAELKKRHLSVPDDISIIGFDNLPHGLYADPGLTTIAQDISKKAKVACNLLLENMENTLPGQHAILDVDLIQRQTVKLMV